jgi:cell division protein FtsB
MGAKKSAGQKALQLLQNKYLIATLAILIWMLFLDRNNLIHQVQKSMQLEELKAEKAYYKEKIQETREARRDLMKNSQSLERFAREEYFMKKPDEDVYIIVDEPKQEKPEP